MMKLKIMLIAVVLLSVNVALATVVQGIDIEFVTIGNPGNPGDTVVMTRDGTTGYGAVSYNYSIGKHEITNGQWDAFVSEAGAPTGNPVNAYNESATYLGTDVPTNTVSWYEAAQFCNYLTTGDKSLGAYQFSGNNTNPGDFEGIDRDSAISTYDMVYVIPTEDEWYKAAYYTTSGYSNYANGSDTIPAPDDGWNYGPSLPWNVGTGAIEQNGTFDMMGNVREWNEALIDGSNRGIRGDSCFGGDDYLRSSSRAPTNPYHEGSYIGFRIVSIPEPATLILLGLGGLVLRRRRKA